MTAPEGENSEQPEPVIRDKRRLDPETGNVRDAPAEAGAPAGEVPEAQAAEQIAAEVTEEASAEADADAAALNEAAAALAAERLNDLQRLQAEYVNYRKRVERDRSLARQDAIGEVVEALMPTLDEIALARQHGDLVEGSPFAAMAEKIEAGLGRFGLERYGEVGDEFDPTIHEALMHQTSAEVSSEQITMVMQPGYRLGERVLRAARVGVTSPE